MKELKYQVRQCKIGYNTEVIKEQTKPQVSYMTNAAVPPNFSSAERKEIIVSKLANFNLTLT